LTLFLAFNGRLPIPCLVEIEEVVTILHVGLGRFNTFSNAMSVFSV